MTAPTHRLLATGELVFPTGYPPEAIEALAEAEWDARELARIKGELRALVDRQAGEVRRGFITDIPGQQLVYLTKAEEAKDWLAAEGAGDPADFAYLAAEAAATLGDDSAANLTARAELIAAAAAQVRAGGALIEAARVAAKEAISAATTIAEAQAAAGVDWAALLT